MKDSARSARLAKADDIKDITGSGVMNVPGVTFGRKVVDSGGYWPATISGGGSAALKPTRRFRLLERSPPAPECCRESSALPNHYCRCTL